MLLIHPPPHTPLMIYTVALYSVVHSFCVSAFTLDYILNALKNKVFAF